MRFVGIYYLFNAMPIWLIGLVLWLATDGAIHCMRDKLEGLGYQVSWSAKFGDAGILFSVLIAATMLQRKGVYVPAWFQMGIVQFGILCIWVAVGIMITLTTLGERSGQMADIYHDVVIVPAIGFFAVTLLPVIFYNAVWYNGLWYEGPAVVLAVVVWAVLVYTDFAGGRINQRQWLVNHGFAITGEIPKR